MLCQPGDVYVDILFKTPLFISRREELRRKDIPKTATFEALLNKYLLVKTTTKQLVLLSKYLILLNSLLYKRKVSNNFMLTSIILIVKEVWRL